MVRVDLNNFFFFFFFIIIGKLMTIFKRTKIVYAGAELAYAPNIFKNLQKKYIYIYIFYNVDLQKLIFSPLNSFFFSIPTQLKFMGPPLTLHV